MLVDNQTKKKIFSENVKSKFSNIIILARP